MGNGAPNEGQFKKGLRSGRSGGAPPASKLLILLQLQAFTWVTARRTRSWGWVSLTLGPLQYAAALSIRRSVVRRSVVRRSVVRRSVVRRSVVRRSVVRRVRG